jgi:hypothetical protein
MELPDLEIEDDVDYEKNMVEINMEIKLSMKVVPLAASLPFYYS